MVCFIVIDLADESLDYFEDLNRSSPAVASAKEERHEGREGLWKKFKDGFNG